MPQHSLILQPATDPDSSCLAPLALYFPSGYSPDQTRDCQWELQTSQEGSNEHYLIGRLVSIIATCFGTNVSVKDDQVKRRGIIKILPEYDLSYAYAIGIRQKGSNILKYAEIQSGQVLRVEPRAVSISYDATDVGASETALDREKLIAQNRRLVDAFGSTRRKRQLKQREGAQVQAGAVGGSQAVISLLQTAGDSAVAAGATKAKVMERALGYRVLPAHHADATTPQEAYKMEEFQPHGVWDMLDTQSMLESMQNPDASTSEPAQEFLQDCWRLVRNAESVEGTRALKGLSYLATALKLFNGSNMFSSNPARGGLQAHAEKLSLHAEVLHSFLESFYEASESDGNTAYSRSDQQRTLLLMHIFATALILQGYQMGPRSCNQLRQAVKLTSMQFSAIFRELGCVVKSSAPKMASASASPARDISVMLLPPPTNPLLPAKKLADYFPPLKLGNKRGRN